MVAQANTGAEQVTIVILSALQGEQITSQPLDVVRIALFVCVKNGGRSQMTAELMRQLAGDTVTVWSAGTKPGGAVNDLRASISGGGRRHHRRAAQAVDYELARDVDLVVTLGREAKLDPLPGTRVEDWDTDEPSARGIEGLERMRLVRDDITARVHRLHTTLTDA